MSKLSKVKIGITGTIGSGKSSVRKIISESYPCISADEIVADLYENKDFVEKINREILNKDSDVINKNLLANKIFNDECAKKELEALIHPLVRKSVSTWLDKQTGLRFVEVPLLYEAKFEDLFDFVVLVVTDQKIIIDRLKKYRGYSKEETLSRIAQQMPVDEKINKSDYIIYNNKNYIDLELNVNEMLDKLEKGE